MNCSKRPCGYMCKEHYNHRGQVQSPQGPGVLSKVSVWLEQRENGGRRGQVTDCIGQIVITECLPCFMGKTCFSASHSKEHILFIQSTKQAYEVRNIILFIVDSLSNLLESQEHTCYEHLWSAGFSLSLFALQADSKKVDEELWKNGDRKWVGRDILVTENLVTFTK